MNSDNGISEGSEVLVAQQGALKKDVSCEVSIIGDYACLRQIPQSETALWISS